jgi:hypothetical protein|tara:strand:+ start:2299 stop:2835 length:537 start_codon:yes stop_codon:yes gene_type:complete
MNEMKTYEEEDELMMNEMIESCQYQVDLTPKIVEMIHKHITPNMKVNIDPFDVIGDMLNTQANAILRGQQGLFMRNSMLEPMLRMEASAPKGMSLTAKAAGGSPTASVKREFGIKKGLSKVKTYHTFRKLRQVVEMMMAYRIDVYELHEYSDKHHYADYDDGTYCYENDCTCEGSEEE